MKQHSTLLKSILNLRSTRFLIQCYLFASCQVFFWFIDSSITSLSRQVYDQITEFKNRYEEKGNWDSRICVAIGHPQSRSRTVSRSKYILDPYIDHDDTDKYCNDLCQFCQKRRYLFRHMILKHYDRYVLSPCSKNRHT